ncbi:SDR family NAD(P)-dependent oxidoreductase [Fibrisoma montanum]|uniref:SDR family NAD(P)-dependent oxidoreductase n=1 Tax=Fibrisoma montanum TaxID=2305895 RepID=A0A418LZ49_9BACT|nr:oxidoreductase [Fibrisoma montanum]RIV18628.1 SDR family NAD(P)-dependent oxidoreductase [Fibrisoma montanum]
MEKWTTDNIPDLSGKTMLVTGANSGIGFETSLALAKKGAHVIMACRDHRKADEAKKRLTHVVPAARITLVTLDLADLDSVRKCVETVRQTNNKLDVLINNAGVMATPYSKTKQGFEMQIGTNYLGHYALTGLLLPLLLATPGSRIVSLSSLGANYGKLDLEDIMSEHKKYKTYDAYSQAKLANLVFAVELARKLEASRSDTMSIAVHPGGSPTNLQRTSGFLMARIITPLLSQAADKAALPSLLAATDPTVSNGSYWGPTGFMKLKGFPGPAAIPKQANDLAAASRLWELGEKLTGVNYSF